MTFASEPILDSSVLGRLLEEVSWEGRLVRRYRQRGLGYENVLTAEVLMALNFLPRQAFLGGILRAAHGSGATLAAVADEIEAAQLTFLPDEIKLRPSGPSYQEQVVVQPDGLLTSPRCLVIVEAKRILRSKFQTEQLAREYVALMRDAAGRTPLLLLLLGTGPFVNVDGHGRITVEDAISLHLAPVLAKTEASNLEHDFLIQQIPHVVAWTTWTEISAIVAGQAHVFTSPDASVQASVRRLAESLTSSIARHGPNPVGVSGG